jgi:hypothetical protein
MLFICIAWVLKNQYQKAVYSIAWGFEKVVSLEHGVRSCEETFANRDTDFDLPTQNS